MTSLSVKKKAALPVFIYGTAWKEDRTGIQLLGGLAPSTASPFNELGPLSVFMG
jgi:hypothetical protein